jgi:Glycosyl hydrolase family 3 C-terminal domain
MDRPDVRLPTIQVKLIRQIARINPNIVLVLLHGGMVGLDDVLDHVKTIVSVGYPGPYAGTVVPRMLYGLEEHGWGKTSVTWYKNSITDELNMLDFDMRRSPGRTYRYYTGVPHFKFGFGLNPLTDFELSGMDIDVIGEGFIVNPLRAAQYRNSTDNTGGSSKHIDCSSCHDIINISLTLSNVGQRDGDEVLMIYIIPMGIPKSEPASKLKQQLIDFERYHISAETASDIQFTLDTDTVFELADYTGRPKTFRGMYEIKVSNGMDYVSKTVFVQNQATSIKKKTTKGSCHCVQVIDDKPIHQQ